MAKITKKEVKTSKVISELENDFTPDEFIEKFKELYPEDWAKIDRCYQEHEQKTKPGKKHPMPHPNQYFKNLLNVFGKNKREIG